MMFVVIAMLIAVVLTNFANNMVIAAVFATLIFTIGGNLGLEILPLIGVLVMCSSLSMATPAACPQAALLFANPWVKQTDLYKYCFIIIAAMFVLTLSVGLFWANIIF